MANKWVYLFTEGNANFLYHRASQLQQKLVLSIMRTAEKSTLKFRVRSTSTS